MLKKVQINDFSAALNEKNSNKRLNFAYVGLKQVLRKVKNISDDIRL